MPWRGTLLASVVKLGGPMAVAPWTVSDGLRERFEPLLPKRERRFRYPGRKRLDDRETSARLTRRRRTCAPARDRKQSPLARNAFQIVGAAILERDPRARDEVLHCGRDEHLARAGE